MKHIISNNVVNVSADTEDPNFPATRLLDNYPSRKYKPANDDWSAILTVDVVGGCSDLMIAGTNAASVSVSVIDPNIFELDTGWSLGTSADDAGALDFSWANQDISTTSTETYDINNDTIWIELSETVIAPCQVILTLSGSSVEPLTAGVITANTVETYSGDNPNFGLDKDQDDRSVSAKNSNGSRYYKKGTVVRVFDVEVEMSRSDSRKLESFFNTQGELPSGWRLTDENSNDYMVFARMSGAPKITDSYPVNSVVNFKLIEEK